MFRVAILVLLISFTLGCGPAKTAGQAKAEAIARRWVASQGYHDPDDATYSAEPNAGGWSVFIEYKPPTVGSHTFIEIDGSGSVVQVHPGE